MGSMFSAPKMPEPVVYQAPPEPTPLPTPEPVPVMPTADTEAVKAAQRRLAATRARTSGRDSTDNTSQGTLG